ncbi:spermatogenesis-associated protein 1-like [Cololabis saira]|uniref:spermatogenesis-associated protein 1-like n=1 Tax=Cololabis saira TaxID=129043 RepID=UPI002AD417CB|nr:spermatogenesis-associated protein 1-like [Cololabis saira]
MSTTVVYPDITLKTLRSELSVLLGKERSINKYSFLKCVGQSLALVKGKQEGDLKVKLFAPPYAAQPELYLLPTVETESSFFSQSFTLDTSSSSADEQTYCPSPRMFSLPMRTKGAVKFPHIPQCSQQPPPTSGLEEEEEDDEDEDEEEDEDNQSCSSSENEEESLCSTRRAEQQSCPGKPQTQTTLQLVSLKKALGRCEAESVQGKRVPNGKETCKKKKPCQSDRNSGAPQSHEDKDSGFSLSDGVGKSKGETLIEEIKLMKEERKQLEWTRQELLRKGKDLLAQSKHRRNLARDRWKKKYFEAKKATAPLEENLRDLRQELEIYYNKLLYQLQARDYRGKQGRPGPSSLKNEVIIQIMKEIYETDDLKRKVEDAKMKLLTEMKLRKQAATELRALRAELAQRKSQSSHPSLMQNTVQNRAPLQSSCI